MVRDYKAPEEHIVNYLDHPIYPNRNLLVRKLDPPQSWNPRVENYLRVTGFYHVSRIGMIRGSHPLLAALVERWRPETHTFVLPVGEVTVTLEDVAHIFGLPIDGEPVSGWTDSSSDFVQSQHGNIRSSTDKSTAYAHAKYLPLLRDFERIHTYSWGSACLAHLYRALCRASRYDTKEMDGPLNLLFVWAWERMPCISPVPRHILPPAEIPVAMRWSHAERSTAWLEKTVVTFRVDIDYMQEFEWRPYQGMNIPVELHRHLDVCDIVAPLLSFECIEWHPTDRVMRQFGFLQPHREHLGTFH
ncbi:serine/threonine-protein phosphatase 7 long form homolog [Arachis hypogaea]|uniref:serine/threonine-protein phosphatase 7 long form homolog n=1 Tax=Arachis hypogaea TaxID=3818 RepID=UPI003B225349